MALVPGTRLGSYEVVAQIGAGGMGEVYRAHDTNLARDVAIKVLPPNFVNDPERLSRFQREARMLAALNHPNIATIYGLEQSGEMACLVMELVPGETLAERVRAGPVPIEEALKIAAQIAEALEAAHEKQIIHRDLKPANVKVTPEGKVKVLDFGLAKAFEGDSANEDMSNSPTLSRAATMQGVILGTAAYMSPEQARGRAVDKRTDIWAFGCVVYELLTAKQAFHGEDVTDILAAVVRAEPNWQALPAAIPVKIRDLLRRCLQKDRTLRLRDAGDARIEINEALTSPATEVAAATAPATRTLRERIAWPVLAGVLALIAIALAIGFFLRVPKLPQPMRFSTEIGVDANLYTEAGPAAILSPDGKWLALVASAADNKPRIYVRPLDQLKPVELPGTEYARDPFFSPDGQWIGFFADGKLKKISVQGGAAVTLCDAPNDRGGSWGDDGTIVFARNPTEALSRISSAGGTPQPLTTLDNQTGELSQSWPQVLPGGRAVLFTSETSLAGGLTFGDAGIVTYSMDSGQRKTLQREGFYARYLPSGHMVYMREGTLFGVPFDLKRLEVTGQAAPILEGIVTNPGYGEAQYSFSNTGDLVYIPQSLGARNVSIFWMDREGKFTPLRDTPGDYRNPAFSPDGKRLALEINDGNRSNIWIDEWERDTLTRLTFDGQSNGYPIWTPDGQRITYSSAEKGGGYNLWWIRADGSGNSQRLTESKTIEYARSWRPDGKILAFRQANAGTLLDILTLSMEGDEKTGWKPGEPTPFLNTTFLEEEPAFSPDGRWLAYMSNESGNDEIYVRPFPGPGGKWQISNGGGRFPKWSRNSKELFYRTADSKIMVLSYTASADSFRADRSQLWSPGQFTNFSGGVSNFDLHPDGKRFAVLKAPNTERAATINKVNIVLNWFEELKQKVPTGNK